MYLGLGPISNNFLLVIWGHFPPWRWNINVVWKILRRISISVFQSFFYAWSFILCLVSLHRTWISGASDQLWCRVPTVGCWAVCCGHPPPPSSPLPSLEQPMGTLASSALVQCHHQGWVGWDGVESKKMGWVRIWVWGDGWLNGWVGGWAVASDGHCREGRSFPNVWHRHQNGLGLKWIS